jgi:hypothetical protein
MPLKARRIDSELESLPKAKATFIEPMLLLRTGALPEAAEWLYELLNSMVIAPSASTRRVECSSVRGTTMISV